MAFIYKNLKIKILTLVPLVLLYYLSFSEIDTDFSNNFEILSFNIQFIIIYYWALREPDILGNGHIFFAGIVNDIIMGLPLGMSALTYLIICFVASYIRTVTVKITLFTDWFTFAIAIFFSNLTYLILISNFSNFSVTYTDLFYNSLFTFIFFPFFWAIFTWYKTTMMAKFNE